MKKIILTSNKYSFCVDGHQELLKRHWKGDDGFTLIGFDKPKIELNELIEFECLGDGFNDSTPWRDALSPFFSNLEDDFFLLVFEDHFLVNDVNLELFNEVEEIMKKDKSIGKVRMAPAYRDLSNPKPINLPSYNENFYKGPTSPNSYLPISLRPAVWRKDLFLKLLHHPRGIKTPHDFETFNNQLDINTVVLLPKGEETIYPEIDAMRYGKPNPIADKASDKINMGYYWVSMNQSDFEVFNKNKIKWNARGK
jgi:hypothetical protein